MLLGTPFWTVHCGPRMLLGSPFWILTIRLAILKLVGGLVVRVESVKEPVMNDLSVADEEFEEGREHWFIYRPGR